MFLMKKLNFKKETIALLSSLELGNVKGGKLTFKYDCSTNPPCITKTCPSIDFTCHPENCL
ncbi:MAG: class I lanthipeptide [Hyphomicrobiales bacterium]